MSSISYEKDKPQEPRYFLLFGTEGPWQEVFKGSYMAAMEANGVKGNAPLEFQVDTLSGTVTTDGSRPKEVKKQVVVEPMVRRSSDAQDASFRLIFPEGSYSVASVGQDSGSDFGTVTVILTPEQYDRFTKAQAPHSLDRIAARLEAKADGSLKGVVLGGIAEGCRKAAQDQRDKQNGKTPTTKRPSLQDLRDLLKG